MQQSNAFFAPTLAADLQTIQDILRDFFATIKTDDWNNKTDHRPDGWTLRETLSHLASVATTYQLSLESALSGQPVDLHGYTRREQLKSANGDEIKRRADQSPEAVQKEFFTALQKSLEIARTVTPEQMNLTFDLFAYNRPASVATLLGSQIAHPGIVHAAQVTNAVGALPLWTHYPPELMERMIARFLRLMSLSYWPERGGNLATALNIRVRGMGNWYIPMRQQGEDSVEGLAKNAALNLWASSADSLCQLFTAQIDPIRAILTGKIIVWGDPRLGLKLPRLFLPT